jgi:glycosyltransferase involved in cell wall biosynthesis
MIRALCHEHEFVVFAAEFENPCPDRVRFVRVPVPTRPLALLFLAYHCLAPLYYWIYCLRNQVRFHLTLMVESNLSVGDVSYVHFCHRAYLKHYWGQVEAPGVRGRLRWIDHWLRALLEPWVYRRVRHIIVPSRGLKREIETEYPFTKGKTLCLPNPVDLERLQPSIEFDRADFRRGLGLNPQDVVLVFVAMGHFERKGLPLLFEALVKLQEPRLKLVVVGGEPDLVAVYRQRAGRIGLNGRVIFVGIQRDVRPYLWAADAFVLPSFYETFSLVSFEAAAAGLPLVVTPFYGVEEFIQDRRNGVLVNHTAEGVAEGIACLLALPSKVWRAMGNQARHDVKRYAAENFIVAWRAFYGIAISQSANANEVKHDSDYIEDQTLTH